jgi:uncharacterized protein YciI
VAGEHKELTAWKERSMRRRRFWFVLLGMTCFAPAAVGRAFLAAAQPPSTGAPREFGKANKQQLEAYVVLLRLRHDLYLRWKDTGKWPDDKQANAALAEHGKYWSKQLKAGRALMAGGMKGDYWDNAALIIFEAGSQAEAEQIVKDDPAVRAYVFQAQVRPFEVIFLSNKYQSDR